jgi:hypothetical protein
MRYPAAMSAILAGAAGAAAVIVVAGGMLVATSSQSMATPAFAQKTGKPCTACHTTPPTLNDAGKKYKESLKK